MPRWDSEEAAENLLALSAEKSDFKIAVVEWHWTGGFIDHTVPTETCGLCENTGLRYHFEILNNQTQNSLWVGSSCIDRFDIAVYGEDGELLAGKARTRKLHEKIQKARVEKALEPLRDLYRVDKEHQIFIKELANERIKNRKGIEPQELLLLFRQLKQHRIAFEPGLYKVTLRSQWHRQQLLHMSEAELKTIWDCLSDKQQEVYQQEKSVADAAERARKLEAERAEEQIRTHAAWLADRTDKQRMTDVEFVESDKLAPEFYGRVEERMPTQAEITISLYPEATCEICGSRTTNYYKYDPVTKMCKCMACYWDQEKNQKTTGKIEDG